MVTHGVVWGGASAEPFWLALKASAKAGVTSCKLGRSIALSRRRQARCTPATFNFHLQRKGKSWVSPSLPGLGPSL